MEYRHPPSAMEYGLYRNEQSADISRPPPQNPSIHPNFSMPPPPFIPNYQIPPPQPPHSMYNPQPISPSWDPSLEVRYNVPFCPQPIPESGSHSHEYFKGPRDSLTSSLSDQNIQSGEWTEDEEWVRQYTMYKLSKSQKVSDVNNCNKYLSKLKIFEAKLCLEECQGLLQELESVEKDLMDRIESSNISEWQDMCKIVEEKKRCLVENLRKLSDPVTVKSLKVALLKRSRKREALKRRRTIRREEKAASLKRQQQLHLSIDTWLEEMQRSVEKVKLEESLKQQADIVLSGVTCKKAEARRQLTLLSMLLKLRRIRVHAAANRGECTSLELAKIFESVIEKLQKFWSDQLKDYNLEEKGLRVMLEEATEDTSNKKKSLQQRILSEWQRVMFGRDLCVDDFFTVAERDVDEFIKIRQDWDKFVVPCGALMASSMPVGWVLPVKPSSEKWEKLLQAKQLDR